MDAVSGPKLTVKGLAQQIDRLVGRAFSTVAVEGELAQVQVPQSGHAYLTLREQDAVLHVVMWRTGGRPTSIEAWAARVECGAGLTACRNATPSSANARNAGPCSPSESPSTVTSTRSIRRSGWPDGWRSSAVSHDAAAASGTVARAPHRSGGRGPPAATPRASHRAVK